MFTFAEFMSERVADPEALLNRASRIYGKKTSFGQWEKVNRGGHIPLSNFNERKTEAASTALWKTQKKFGFQSKDKEERAKGKAAYQAAHSSEHMPIKDLHATQPFVRTDDSDILKKKISETNPNHIHVVTHKGIHYIADGHHAVMAAHARGDKTVPVSRIDLDKHK